MMKTLLATTAALALAASVTHRPLRPRPGTCRSPMPTRTTTPTSPSSSPQCVGTGTGGEIEITVHPAGSLFKGNEIKRAVQTGQAPIGERLLSAHENENPVFGIDSVPFLATTFDQSQALWDAAKPTFEKILDEQNLVLLYSTPWPPQGLYTKKPIESAEDLQGLKFRSYNTMTARIAELTGMVPVQIEAAELSQALATGVAESMFTSGATGYDQKVWENLSHFYSGQRLDAAQLRLREQGHLGRRQRRATRTRSRPAPTSPPMPASGAPNSTPTSRCNSLPRTAWRCSRRANSSGPT